MSTHLGMYRVMSLGAVVFTLTGCFFPNGNSPTGDNSITPQARFVQFYNCTHVNDAYGAPSGRAFNVFTRAPGGAWVARGGLNPQPGAWSDCHDDAHTASSLTVDILDPPGKWEVRSIMLPRADEPSCDSSAPDVPNACRFVTHFFQTNVAYGTLQVNITDSDGY